MPDTVVERERSRAMRLGGLGLLLALMSGCGDAGGTSGAPARDAGAYDGATDAAASRDAVGSQDAAWDAPEPDAVTTDAEFDGGSLPAPTDEHLTDIAQAPDRVHFRTNLRSFNSRYYAVVANREIYIRANAERTGLQSNWERVVNLPAGLAGDVVGIALDDRFLMAVNSARKLYEMAGALGDPSGFRWQEYRGFPFASGAQNYLPIDSIKWDKSVASAEEDENYTDPAGHLFPVGSSTCAHVVVLRGGGQQIAFNDAWLPADFGSEVCGPRRGRFRARAMSTSGSTTAVMNKYGDIYTRHWDFDIGGSNTLFWSYSYYDQSSVPNPVVQLPSAAWVQQPKVDGRITDTLSIHKTGKNCVHRILRVEGLDANGQTGYFERDIADPATAGWVFHVTSLPILGHFIESPAGDTSDRDLGASDDLSFGWNLGQLPQLDGAVPSGGVSTADFAAELLDYNLYCSPAALRVHLTATDYIDLVLHSTEPIRLTEIHTRGLTEQARARNGALEVPRSVLDDLPSLSPKARAFVSRYFADQQFTNVNIQADLHTVRLDGGAIQWSLTR
ncbi:MAG: hypothetical protein IT376_11340 [Polyangiaceae bacterium]|nr:hypothetical protein [Polyangiaceae bacterium]